MNIECKINKYYIDQRSDHEFKVFSKESKIKKLKRSFEIDRR